jgi:hypothetical protein
MADKLMLLAAIFGAPSDTNLANFYIGISRHSSGFLTLDLFIQSCTYSCPSTGIKEANSSVT